MSNTIIKIHKGHGDNDDAVEDSGGGVVVEGTTGLGVVTGHGGGVVVEVMISMVGGKISM